MSKKETDSFCPTSRKDWRKWLEKNHEKEDSVWLIYYKKGTGKSSLSWSDAVEEALCFGWIDSVRQTVDTESFRQFFGKRKANSTWSKINKGKIETLIADGLMAEAGFASIELAKQNGSWSILDEVEELTIPEDLKAAFAKQNGSQEFFLGLSRSVRKAILQWLMFAKRAETREKRIVEIATLAGEGKKPKQF